MEVYEVNYNTKVKIIDENVKIPPGAKIVKKDDIVTIFKLDGMYCNGIDETGERIYIGGWTKVEIV